MAAAQDQGGQQACDAAADMPLPADVGAEAVYEVQQDPPEGIGDIPPVLQVVDQCGCHQPPDRSAGPGMQAVPAPEIDQQPGADDAGRINRGISGGADFILQVEAVGKQADHIAGKMGESEMEKCVCEDPDHFAVLDGPLVHAVLIDGPVLSDDHFINQSDQIQHHHHAGDRRQLLWQKSHFTPPCFP